jgi:hypothetical protein
MLPEGTQAAGTLTPRSTCELLVPRPQPDTWREVQSSCRRLFRDEPHFVAAFQQCLLEVLPVLRGRVADGGVALSAYLARALVWAALCGHDQTLIEEVLHRVGGQIGQHGFPGDGYLALEHAVLRSARVMQEAEWDSPRSAAWVDYLTWFTAHLQIGYLNPPAEPAAPPAEVSAVDDEVRAVDDEVSAVDTGDLPAYRTVSQASAEVAAPVGRHHRPPDSDLFALLPASLGQVMASLREQHFPAGLEAVRCPAEARQVATHRREDERTLDAVCSTVAARTGADLRAPRPEQKFDRVLIERVLTTLGELGYLLGSPYTS